MQKVKKGAKGKSVQSEGSKLRSGNVFWTWEAQEQRFRVCSLRTDTVSTDPNVDKLRNGDDRDSAVQDNARKIQLFLQLGEFIQRA